MSDPFLGQIEVFGFGFPPKNWVQCRGQILPINQYQALFSLLGTTFGGNGVTTFALPDLQGRVPVGVGLDPVQAQWVWGQKGGSESIALTSFQIPAHLHTLKAAASTDISKNQNRPANTVGLGQTTGKDQSGNPMVVVAYVADPNPAASALHESALSPGGAAQPHENRMPALVLNICISLAGVFPSRS